MYFKVCRHLHVCKKTKVKNERRKLKFTHMATEMDL